MRDNRLFTREYKKIKQKHFDINTLDVNAFCDSVVSYKTKTDSEKLDALLELDSTLYTELGVASSKKEKQETKKKSRAIYRAIKTFNKSLGNSFLDHMDVDE